MSATRQPLCSSMASSLSSRDWKSSVASSLWRVFRQSMPGRRTRSQCLQSTLVLCKEAEAPERGILMEGEPIRQIMPRFAWGVTRRCMQEMNSDNDNQDGDQEPSKEADRQHSAAHVWRSMFCSIASRLAGGDVGFRSLPFVHPVSEDLQAQIKYAVAEYGESLVDLSDRAWGRSVYQWMDDHWEVLVDLSTRESEVNDLVLHALVSETECRTGYRVEIVGVYVP